MHPRVLIVGTVPYNTKSTSRAFDAYFHYWEKENIAQIFSNTKKPCKGHCETLFQITDHRVLQRWMGKKIDTGVIYHYDELDTEWKDNDLELGDMQSTDAAMVCTDKTKLADSITQLISDQELQKKYYEQAIVITREHHNLQASCKTSENVVAKAIQHMK